MISKFIGRYRNYILAGTLISIKKLTRLDRNRKNYR